jgi:hypothetical protein
MLREEHQATTTDPARRARLFPCEMLWEEQQAAATDPARQARLAAEASCSRWRAEDAETERVRNATNTNWSDRRPRVLPPPDVWAEGQIDLGALCHLPPPDHWSESDVEAAAVALSNPYYSAARKICDNASDREGKYTRGGRVFCIIRICIVLCIVFVFFGAGHP